MVRRLFGVLALSAIVVATSGIASADHTASCNGTVTAVETPAATLYIDDRGVDSGGVWIYQESNGQAGLQSGGDSLTLGETDTCEAVGHPAPDTLLV